MADQPPKDILQILGPNERIELFIRQKIYHPRFNVDYFVMTNERIIFRHPHLLGRLKNFTDFNYQQFSNVKLHEGPLRSDVTCVFNSKEDPLVLKDLPHEDAKKAAGIIREFLVRYQAPFTSAPAGIPPVGQAAGSAPGLACKQCGSPVTMNQRFCGNCGAPV